MEEMLARLSQAVGRPVWDRGEAEAAVAEMFGLDADEAAEQVRRELGEVDAGPDALLIT